MEFIDKTGHVFSMKSYSEKPIGYEYDETPYIFWVNEKGKLAVNNYYVLPVRFILPSDMIFNPNGTVNELLGLRISMDSANFKLLGSKELNNLLNQSKNIFDYIDIDDSTLFKNVLTEDDVIVVSNVKKDIITDKEIDETYNFVTFYVVSNLKEESVFLTNVLIEIGRYYEGEILGELYCPLTVGAEAVDESEELVINGKNMGINLPKDILRAIYDSSFYNIYADENLYNKKLKELLINYMDIKGECGNFKSAIDALKWFGWGTNIKISKLLQTDNEFINQYILDYFDINNDTLKSFVYFRNATFVTLRLDGDVDTNIPIPQDFNNDFWGEGHSIIKDLVNSTKEYKYDEQDISFYAPYYNFLFTELGLKLSALKYYYEKYFLPVHLKVHSIAVTKQVFMNDNKLVLGVNNALYSETPQLIYEKYNTRTEVEFPESDHLLFYQQRHYIDENYNEFYDYIINNDKYDKSDDITIYYVNDTCLSVPINFNTKIYNSETNKWENKLNQYYNCQLILERVNRTTYNYQYSFIHKKFTFNDINNLIIKDIKGIKCNIYTHVIFTVFENNKKVYSSLECDLNDMIDYAIKNYYYSFNEDNVTFDVIFLYYNEISEILINDKNILVNYNKDYKLNIVEDKHEIIFETKFSFMETDKDSYKDLVIVPKVFGRSKDLGYWINSVLDIHLNVNGEWFNYEFIAKLPEVNIELGKLEYKYFLDYYDTDILTVGNDIYHTIGIKMFGENEDGSINPLIKHYINRENVVFDIDEYNNILYINIETKELNKLLLNIINDFNLDIDPYQKTNIKLANEIFDIIGNKLFGEDRTGQHDSSILHYVDKTKVKFTLEQLNNIIEFKGNHAETAETLKQIIFDNNLNIDTVEYLLKGYNNPNILNNGIPTPFNQLRKIDDSTVYFNNFIWQPSLVQVNNIDFFDDLLSAYKDLEFKNRDNTFFNTDLIDDIRVLTFESEDTPIYYVLPDGDKLYYVTKNDIINAYKDSNSIIVKSDGICWDTENEISFYWHVKMNHPELILNDGTIAYNLLKFKHDDGTGNDNCYKVETDSMEWNNPDAYEIETNSIKNDNIYWDNSDKYNDISFFWHVVDNHPSETKTIKVKEGDKEVEKEIIVYNKLDFNNDDGTGNDKCWNVELDTLNWNENTRLYGIWTDKEHSNVIYFRFNHHTVEFIKLDTITEEGITRIVPRLLKTYKTIYNDINSILEKYKELPNIANNDKYLNRVHMFNISKNNYEFKYNSDDDISTIYRAFFNDNGESRVLIPTMGQNYDFYLMHDLTDWYAIFISKYTNDRMYNESKIIDDSNYIFPYENIIGTYEVIDNGTNELDFRDINNEIIRKLLLEQINMRLSDLIVTYNHTVYADGEIKPETIDLHYIESIDELNNAEKYPAHKNYIISNIYIRGRYKINKDTGIYFLEYEGDFPTIEELEELNLNPNIIILNWHTQDINYEYEKVNGNYEYVCHCDNVSNNFVRWNNNSAISYTAVYDLLNDYNYKVIIDGNTKHHIYNKLDIYKFNHIKSDDKFLINRMQYIPSNGYNVFNQDDIIVCTLANNDRLEFKYDIDYKWTVTPYSLKMDNASEVCGAAETAIISLGDKNIKYSKGYYNVTCSFSIDAVIENIINKTARFLIEKYNNQK